MSEGGSCVGIRPWSAGDLSLLERLLGDPAMMEHLGGPDTRDAIRARHERYLGFDGSSEGVFAIVVGSDETPAGWIGYWTTSWHDEDVWECGWHVLPERQSRGVATAAAVLAIEHARARGGCRWMHAFPAVDNVASNALCRRLGFTSLGEVDVEYPVGHMMHSNDWCLDLLGERQA